MKGSYMNTHLGNITIDKEVIAQYAGSVAVECFGIVGLAGINMKDGLVKLLKKERAQSDSRGLNPPSNQKRTVHKALSSFGKGL